MTPPQALNILEGAVLECMRRDVNTAEVREALNFLEPHIRPRWLIPRFRSHIKPGGDTYFDLVRRQEVLCGTFPGIRDGVRALLAKHMDKLASRQVGSQNRAVIRDLERLGIARGTLRQPSKRVTK
jgi:hypothetical protein